jgi:hypothetical protein
MIASIGSHLPSFFGYSMGKIMNYWMVPERDKISSWADETALGRKLADEMFERCDAEELAMLLPKVVACMPSLEGVEIGFLTRVGEIAALAKPQSEMCLAA